MSELVGQQDQKQGERERNTVQQVSRPLRQQAPGTQEGMEEVGMILVGSGPQRREHRDEEQAGRKEVSGKRRFVRLLTLAIVALRKV